MSHNNIRVDILPFLSEIMIKEKKHGLLIGLIILSLIPIPVYFPNFIPYFNMIIGGPNNGHYYLSDSNIDWGQDLPGLKDYLKKNDITNIRLIYFGRGNIKGYEINYTDHMKTRDSCTPRSGLLAVSVTRLTGPVGNPDCIKWLWKLEPIDNIGHSILIYNVTKEQELRLLLEKINEEKQIKKKL